MVQTYVIASTEIKLRVKIGRSINPVKRLNQLQTGNGDKLFIVGVSDDLEETALHQKYSQYRHQGEWFDLPIQHFIALTQELNHPAAAKTQDNSTTINGTVLEVGETTQSTINPPQPISFNRLNVDLFNLKYFEGDLYIITGSNALKNFVVKLDQSDRPICAGLFCQQSRSVKPLSPDNKIIAIKNGLLEEDEDDIEIVSNYEDLITKFTTIMKQPNLITPPSSIEKYCEEMLVKSDTFDGQANALWLSFDTWCSENKLISGDPITFGVTMKKLHEYKRVSRGIVYKVAIKNTKSDEVINLTHN